MKKKFKVLLIIILMFSIAILVFLFYNNFNFSNKLEKDLVNLFDNNINVIKKEIVISSMKTHHGKNVDIIVDANIYKKNNDDYEAVGTIYKGNTISLENQSFEESNQYFYNKDLDIYLKYDDVFPTNKEISKDLRYKKYIPFNENIITKNTYTIYRNDGSKLYTLEKKAEYPIIIKDDDSYYIDFNDELVYILKSDVESVIEHKNTDLTPVSSIPVLNYHFVYDPKEMQCNQRICITTDLYTQHIKYLKANFLDLTMKEFDLFMNNKIRLPKSILLTHDDGWLRMNAIKILEENEFHATYFLITSDYKLLDSKYVEFHSHTHNMHTTGVCKGGQGGGIRCLSEAVIQEDLKKSREALNNTTYFCYPFYERNDYAINQLKKAGFTLAFIGGNKNAKPSDNHYLIPRYPIYKNMTVDYLKNLIKFN